MLNIHSNSLAKQSFALMKAEFFNLTKKGHGGIRFMYIKIGKNAFVDGENILPYESNIRGLRHGNTILIFYNK